MIKAGFLKKQIDKSKKQNRTSNFIRKLVFYVVEKSLKDHYGDDYSMKCLQSSVAIANILNDFGIKTKEYVGAVCVSQVFDDFSRAPSWNGFWGEDHHIWCVTEFGEIIDLTISALHLHPLSRKYAQIPVPAVWWSDIGHWPLILKYLPQGVPKIDLPNTDEKDLERFKKIISREVCLALQEKSVEEVQYEPILHGIDSLNELHELGNPWLRGSLILQEAKVPYPPWVIEREQTLTREFNAKRKRIKSALSISSEI